jgi:TrkA domain protein
VPPPRTRATRLPGIGVQYDLTTLDGRHLSVTAHRDGSRCLNAYRDDDPDACALSLRFTGQEAAVLADALMPVHHDPRLVHATDLGLVAEKIPLPVASRWNGCQLGETRLRTRTGSSVVAALRGADAIPSPMPGFRLAGGDTLVVIGTRESADAAAAILMQE